MKRFRRLLRVVAHLFSGLRTLRRAFPIADGVLRRKLQKQWSLELLRLLDVELHIAGTPPPAAIYPLVIANHVSWLDVFVIAAAYPSTFVSKSEIREWPLAGKLAIRTGTLFLERGRAAAARKLNQHIASELQSSPVTVFPEGTTSRQGTLLPFHAAMLQPAVDVGAPLLPLAVRYRNNNGEINRVVEFIGDMTFLQSLWRIAGETHIHAELTFLTPIDAGGGERRELARKGESIIAAALDVPLPQRG